MLRHKVHALGFNRASLRFIFAGGKGGSITILCNSLSHAKRAMIRESSKRTRCSKTFRSI
jgi:predicted ATPase